MTCIIIFLSSPLEKPFYDHLLTSVDFDLTAAKVDENTLFAILDEATAVGRIGDYNLAKINETI